MFKVFGPSLTLTRLERDVGPLHFFSRTRHLKVVIRVGFDVPFLPDLPRASVNFFPVNSSLTDRVGRDKWTRVISEEEVGVGESRQELRQRPKLGKVPSHFSPLVFGVKSTPIS